MRRFVVLALTILLVPQISPAYSVLTHEAVIDSAWDAGIKPLLLARYPSSTEDQLREAKSYAYGGSVIQDLGYYPFGSRLFTNLVHYVRSGDFVQNMLREAQNEDEYAFALGAAAHFVADDIGHPVAINRSVPLAYPKLRRKFGNSVTYEEGKKEHILVEFSFDVIQVAARVYAPQTYHDFIGFQVAKPLLERAFQETYGLEMKDIFFNEDLAIGTYRRGVSKTIPHITRVAWSQKHDQIAQLVPGIQRSRFVYRLSRREYRQSFGETYRSPSFGAAIVAFLLKIVPKVGPFRTLSFKPPNQQMEMYFLQSLMLTAQRYDEDLRQVKVHDVMIPNEDIDTGEPTKFGEYQLADETYAQLLDKLADRKFKDISASLRNDVLRFYASAGSDPLPDVDKKHWKKTQNELDQLKDAVAENDTSPGDRGSEAALGH
jgi:zinc dependent phospholipase C